MEGELQPCLLFVPTLGAYGSESAPSAISIAIIFQSVLLSAQSPGLPLKPFLTTNPSVSRTKYEYLDIKYREL